MIGSLSVFGAFTLASSVVAAPWSSTVKHATHRVRSLEHGVDVKTFQPRSVYETFGEGIDHPLSKRDIPADPADAALSFLSSTLGVELDDISYLSGFDGETAKYVYARQRFNGIDVANSVANVALKNDKVVAYGASFIKPVSIAGASPSLSVADAIANAEKSHNAKYDGWPIKLEYFALDTDHVILTHVVEVKNDDHWYAAYINAHNGELVNTVDYVADASYRVIPFTNVDQTTEGFKLEVNPSREDASPKGWHTSSTDQYTRGNNVHSYTLSDLPIPLTLLNQGPAPQSSAGQIFDYPFDPSQTPYVKNNLRAAVVNGFYVGNSIHDLAYRYGFTEAAFNFQNDNYGKGGQGKDAVSLHIHAPGENNANFATPPDGRAPTCNMFLWDETTPERDGALENDIITHEFMHGISNRLTGGGQANCLQTTEAGGMGEGWSDTLAFAVTQKSSTPKDFVVGAYVTDDPKGIRHYPYSTSKDTNPLTYGSLKTLDEVHYIGEAWANMLVNLFWELVKARGFDLDIFNPNQTVGNIVFLHLFIDSFSLQPCNPTFRTARDAIIQADKNRYDGENYCTIWRVFASRGLGVNAKDSVYVDDNTVPDGC